MKIVISYIPVLHQGYLDFIHKVKPDALYILGEEFYQDFRPIEKDIRKLKPQVICEQLKVSDIKTEKIEVLTNAELATIDSSSKAHFILPSEDISRLFAEKYLANQDVEFIDFFLRWDTEASLKQKEIKEKYLADLESFESQMLGLAYAEAEKSSDLWRQVGAVIVKDKEIVLKTYNTHLPSLHTPYFNGDPRGNFKKGIHIELSTALHAEAALIAAAAKQGLSLQDTEIYVTTFPCPNCAKLIAHSGIKKLYFAEGYSMLDGEEILKAEGVEIVQVSF